MDEWDYRTIDLHLEQWMIKNERVIDYVATLADGTRLEGIETLLRRYLDDGGWDLVTMIPISFYNTGMTHEAKTLRAIFRRRRL